ncbi:hypothetical protein [Rhodococcoides yunnanense]|uniref:hypothetical protein n=1 Tax=Rhodococcoides yunnanense TaxID=278209 RepID=UPI000934B1FB|nr:hypothetical protein [Rhodococcus yunnanensis]
MNHERILRAVAFVAAGYVLVLVVWATWLRPHTEPGTLPYQLTALVAGFAVALGVAMMVANRRTAEERALAKKGIEGWARVEAARKIDDTSTELHLEFTVPGADSFAGRIVYRIPPDEATRFEPGQTLPIMVDPSDHHRVLLLPGQPLDQE